MDIGDWLIKAFAKPSWHLIAPMFVAVGFYALDAWVLMLPVISFTVLALILPCFLLAAILCLFRRLRPRAFKAMRFIGVLFLGAVAAVETVHFHKELTQCRAVKLGQACQAYHAKYHHYPERLDDLVPEFVASVPLQPPEFLEMMVLYILLTMAQNRSFTTIVCRPSGTVTTTWNRVAGGFLTNSRRRRSQDFG